MSSMTLRKSVQGRTLRLMSELLLPVAAGGGQGQLQAVTTWPVFPRQQATASTPSASNTMAAAPSVDLHEALLAACQRGDVDAIKSLIPKKLNVDTRCGTFQDSALHVACVHGRVQAAAALLQLKAEVNLQNGGGKTPLFLACEAKQTAIVRLLVAHGADPNLMSPVGKTLLGWACYESNYPMVEALLSANFIDSDDKSTRRIAVDVNAKDMDEMTALHHACSIGSVVIVQLLMDKNADVHVRDRNEITPLMKACINYNYGVVEYLLKHNPDLAIVDPSYPMHYAATTNNRALVQALLQSDMDVDHVDILNATPLHFACGAGHLAVADLLLRNWAQVNAKDSSGKTPLHYAATMPGNLAMFELLLKFGGKVNARTNEGHTALHSKIFNGDAEMKEFLWRNLRRRLHDEEEEVEEEEAPSLEMTEEQPSVSLSEQEQYSSSYVPKITRL